LADLIWEASEELAAEHGQAFRAAMQAYHTGRTELAEQHWQELQTIWSRAWSANYAALKLLQNARITTFSPLQPQRWMVASFEHHCGPHGLPHPHVHNILITQLANEDLSLLFWRHAAVLGDPCAVCGAEKHPQAYACTRCKRILDRIETRRDAS